MPKIPVYQQQTTASGALPQSFNVGPRGEGLDALGNGLLHVAGLIDQRQEADYRKFEADAISSAHLSATKATAEWETHLVERQQSAEAGAPGFTPKLLDDFDKYQAETLKVAKSDQARQYLDEQMIGLRANLQQRAMQFEAKAGVAHRGAQMADAADQMRVAIRANPELFDQQIAAYGAALDSAGLPPEVHAKLWADAKEGGAASAVESLVERDPLGTLKALQSAPGKSGIAAVEALSADGRDRARNAAEAEIRRREMDARAAMAERRDGLREAEADAFAAKAAGIKAELPTRGAYIAAYGEEGGKRYEQASKLFSVYDVASAAAALPPEQGAAMIAQFRPTQQEGAAAQSEVQSAAAKLYVQQRKALEDDPAAGIMNRDPAIRDLFTQAANGDAAATTQYVSRVRAKAEAMGLPPVLLPKVSADSLAASLTFDPENPKRRTETLQALREQWGRHYPQIIREVAPKLEADARIVADMTPENAARYDAVIGEGRDKVMSLLDSKTKGIVQQEARKVTRPLLETLLSNGNAEAEFAEHLDAVQLMAASLVNRGADPTTAAERAFDMVIGSRYDFRGSMRIPKGIDADEVDTKSASVRMGINPANLAVKPLAFSTEEQAQEALADRIRKEGEWFTLADDTGVELRVPVEGRGLLPVVTKDGKRVRYTWSQLRAANTAPELLPYEPGAR